MLDKYSSITNLGETGYLTVLDSSDPENLSAEVYDFEGNLISGGSSGLTLYEVGKITVSNGPDVNMHFHGAAYKVQGFNVIVFSASVAKNTTAVLTLYSTNEAGGESIIIIDDNYEPIDAADFTISGDCSAIGPQLLLVTGNCSISL